MRSSLPARLSSAFCTRSPLLAHAWSSSGRRNSARAPQVIDSMSVSANTDEFRALRKPSGRLPGRQCRAGGGRRKGRSHIARDARGESVALAGWLEVIAQRAGSISMRKRSTGRPHRSWTAAAARSAPSSPAAAQVAGHRHVDVGSPAVTTSLVAKLLLSSPALPGAHGFFTLPHGDRQAWPRSAITSAGLNFTPQALSSGSSCEALSAVMRASDSALRHRMSRFRRAGQRRPGYDRPPVRTGRWRTGSQGRVLRVHQHQHVYVVGDFCGGRIQRPQIKELLRSL